MIEVIVMASLVTAPFLFGGLMIILKIVDSRVEKEIKRREENGYF